MPSRKADKINLSFQIQKTRALRGTGYHSFSDGKNPFSLPQAFPHMKFAFPGPLAFDRRVQHVYQYR
jgi:hypothetical protein